MRYILALDQGTTSSRAIVFDQQGAVVAVAQREFEQIFPQAGWVEHDPEEIWSSQISVAVEALSRAQARPRDLAGIGITNQRETAIVWNRETGKPIHNAIVWQDRRTADFCGQLRAQGHESLIQQRTGLLIDSYFSGTKVAWILDHVEGARKLAEAGKLAFGTVDSWLVWNLTSGRVHLTDISNASRTMLFNIHTGQMGRRTVAAAQYSSVDVARGAQLQRSLCRGHNYFGPGKRGHCGDGGRSAGVAVRTALYFSGADEEYLRHRMLHAAKHRHAGGTVVEPAGDDGRLEDRGRRPNMPSKAACLSEARWCSGCAMGWGLFVLPARSSNWRRRFPTTAASTWCRRLWDWALRTGTPTRAARFFGLTRGSSAGHLARAALESIAYQVADLLDAMQRDAATPIQEMRVDGGASANDTLMQFQADIMNIPVVRPEVTETTALGAAYLAGMGVGFWRDAQQIATMPRAERRFEPKMPAAQAAKLRERWNLALSRAKAWEPEAQA